MVIIYPKLSEEGQAVNQQQDMCVQGSLMLVGSDKCHSTLYMLHDLSTHLHGSGIPQWQTVFQQDVLP